MTRFQFLKELEKLFAVALKICTAKNADYATGTDPFLNFRSATNVGLTVEQGIVIRMQDKLTRVGNVVAKGGDVAVRDEKLEDTLMDLMVYAGILIIWLTQRRGKTIV